MLKLRYKRIIVLPNNRVVGNRLEKVIGNECYFILYVRFDKRVCSIFLFVVVLKLKIKKRV